MIVKPETASKERRLTPLWIISLFVGLTEAVLAAAVTQSLSGNIKRDYKVFGA